MAESCHLAIFVSLTYTYLKDLVLANLFVSNLYPWLELFVQRHQKVNLFIDLKKE